MGGWAVGWDRSLLGACQQQGCVCAALGCAVQSAASMAAEGHTDAAQLASLFCLTPASRCCCWPPSARQAVSLVEWPERLAMAGPQQQPVEPLEVTISILSQAEQAAVEASAAGRRAAAAASSSSSSSNNAQAAGAEDDGLIDDLGSSSSGDDEEGGGDRRWRRVQLLTAGQRWRPRLQLLQRYLAAEGAEVGCYLDD